MQKDPCHPNRQPGRYDMNAVAGSLAYKFRDSWPVETVVGYVRIWTISSDGKDYVSEIGLRHGKEHGIIKLALSR